MAYSELIKNFEKIRRYMREFYVYGFKSRNEYDDKSVRSYDDEKRRLESWLKDYMRFTQTPEGKKVFLSVDSRIIHKNPFYKAWKSKSFTDGDITLHFAIFDILYKPEIKRTLAELIEEIDVLLSSKITFDESTLLIKNERNALERVMLHFSHFEKRAERIKNDQYILRLKYYRSDEIEVLIRVLSFGPCIRVLEPKSFIDLIKERLFLQKSCGLE